MKYPLLCLSLVCLSAPPSLAQERTALQQAMDHGITLHGELYGRPVDMQVTFRADGASTTHIVGAAGKGADIPGSWRLRDGQICTTNLMNPEENCFAIPADKKPGEAFSMMTPALGEVTLMINP